MRSSTAEQPATPWPAAVADLGPSHAATPAATRPVGLHALLYTCFGTFDSLEKLQWLMLRPYKLLSLLHKR